MLSKPGRSNLRWSLSIEWVKRFLRVYELKIMSIELGLRAFMNGGFWLWLCFHFWCSSLLVMLTIYIKKRRKCVANVNLFSWNLNIVRAPFLGASYGIKRPRCSFGSSIFSYRCGKFVLFTALSGRGWQPIG